MSNKQLLPVLQVNPKDLPPRALVVGDPRRAAEAARLLKDAVELAHNREYRIFVGFYADKPVTVCSHGVGGAGASVCFAELFQAGIKTIIRAGTCGALQPEINDGDLIIGLAAIREDGCSPALIPSAYPAVADWQVVAALVEVVSTHSTPAVHQGIVLTQAYLYPGPMPTTTELWMKAGAICVEMEYATLLVMASLNGARAGGIFATDGNLARLQGGDLRPEDYNPNRQVVQRAKQHTLHIALAALARLP